MSIRPALAAACLLALAAPLPASEPVPVQPGPGELLTAPPGLHAAVAVDPPAPADTHLRFDAILGLPTALRVQARLSHTRLWAECGGGFYLIFPGVFAGLRVDAPVVETCRDCLLFRPGVTGWFIPAGDTGGGGYLGGEYRNVGIVSLDADAIWRHRWTGRFHTDLGVKFGLGLGIGNGVIPLPHLGLLVGCEY
jgi:hypothetical protein